MPKDLADDVPALGPIVIFNIESLLVDTVAGVRRALDSVARLCGHRGYPDLSHKDLRSRSLGDLIGEMAGRRDATLATEFVEHYWRVYERHARHECPLLPGAATLLGKLPGLGSQLHYLSTAGPECSTRIARRHDMQEMLTSVYTLPTGVCPGARGALLEQFFRTQDLKPSECLVLSDCTTELCAAQRLGVPALGLGYGHSPLKALEGMTGLVGVAHSPGDVAAWLAAESATRNCLRTMSRRFATQRLH